MFWQNVYASTINLPQASTVAANVDRLHDFLFWLSVFFLALVTVLMLWLVTAYHRTKTGRKTEYILGSHTLEATWTIIPLILMLFIFAWGYRDYLTLRKDLPNALEINVIARQWMWNFEYANGRRTLNELYIPKGRNVRLIMTSEDVLHSFFVPNFRLKQDVVPGMYTTIQFNNTIVGKHPIYCTEYCGAGHSDMLAEVISLEPADYDRWYRTGKTPEARNGVVMAAENAAQKSASAAPSISAAPSMSLADKGKELYQSKGCFACHTTDGTIKIGPSYKGIYGREEIMQDGTKVKVDENYLRESIMEPQKKIVKGFPPSMPTFKGLVSDDEMNAIIAYIKSLK